MVGTLPVGGRLMRLSDWEERCTDQDSCYLIVRLEACRLRWYDQDGHAWTREFANATVWPVREDAYQTARQVGGLLNLYTRAEGLF